MSQLFTFDDHGIKFLGFQDIRDSMKTQWKAVLGNDIDLSPTTPDGHHLDLECKVINSVSEMIQVVTNLFNRNSSSGQFLEFLAALLGLSRGEGESDESLRSRMQQAPHDGLATMDAMTSYLMNYISPNVSVAFNDEPETSEEGVPGHSFMVTVPEDYIHTNSSGNDDTADWIAQKIFECKPAGIRSSGNHSGTAVSRVTGKSYSMKYSTPSMVGIDVSVKIEKRYDEEAYPYNGDELVKKAIVEWAKTEYKAGKDVIALRMMVPLFSVPGIAIPTIRLKKSLDSKWSEDGIIQIDSEQVAVVSESHITVES